MMKYIAKIIKDGMPANTSVGVIVYATTLEEAQLVCEFVFPEAEGTTINVEPYS